jgi:hypothetical protein
MSGNVGGSSGVGGMSGAGCDPLGFNKIVCYDCGTNPADCANCVPVPPPTPDPCPNPMVGMGTKDLVTGNFVVPVSGLIPGHFIYCSDGCNDPAFQVGQEVVVQAAPVAPLLSPQMLMVLVATLALVGLVGLARMRLNK